jgi:ribosome biogenesis GTPase / thiamine phosphate phosphatase
MPLLTTDVTFTMNTESQITTLEELGYDLFYESNRKTSGLTAHSMARVIAEYKEAYRVKSIHGEYLAKITGKQIFRAVKREDYPAVGDWAAITELDREKAVIHGILPRKTILRKKYSNKQETQVIAANVDSAFIVESIDRDFNLNRFERYFVLAREGNIDPIIVLNKIDLIPETELNLMICRIKDRFNGIDAVPTSVIAGRGLDELEHHIARGKTYCFLGSSGVGKSSLINRLLGTDAIKTAEIGISTGRGRHVTTTREMYFLKNGGIVIDNPGIRQVGLADSEIGVNDVFGEITALSVKCKYANCSHTHEPGCAVLAAVKNNDLNEDKYSNYVKLKKETEYYDLTEIEKRRKDRSFGRFVKKTLNQLKKYDQG